MTEKRKYYGYDESEPFMYDDPDECAIDYIDYSGEIEVGQEFTIYVGEGKPSKASAYIPDVAEYMSERADDNVSEAGERWWGDLADHENSLQDVVAKAVDDYCTEHGIQPDFCELRSLRSLTYRRTEDGVELVLQQLTAEPL